MVVHMDSSGLNEWELDRLIRAHVIEDINAIRENFKDIHEMMDTVAQLPIHQPVSLLISSAVDALDHAVMDCEEGRYDDCVSWSRKAHELSHTADYHPSMIPALYFSTEFTYAVYSPYFLPGYIPVVIAAIKVCVSLLFTSFAVWGSQWLRYKMRGSQ